MAGRPDSTVTVPEPELALVVNAGGEVVGYTVNDMSSRDIEGENPLYIPQAKTYAGSCAIAVGVRPVWEVRNVGRLSIRLTVQRDGAVAFAGETSTANLHRPLLDLVDHLIRAIDFPGGAVLSTGTGIVPTWTSRCWWAIVSTSISPRSGPSPIPSAPSSVPWAGPSTPSVTPSPEWRSDDQPVARDRCPDARRFALGGSQRGRATLGH